MNDLDFTKKENLLEPVKAIQLKCLECCAFRSYGTKACNAFSCPLWAYRTGNPQGYFEKEIIAKSPKRISSKRINEKKDKE